MEARKLSINEHGKTRKLWENVFPEDSKEFLDYYYFLKTRENEIYVMEDDQYICSMLQLNPYLLKLNEKQFTGHYVIAVATDPEYRKRGFMGTLLRKSMKDMYDRNEIFTFLMPADERIYLPYDFRFVYDQNVSLYQKDESTIGILKDSDVEIVEAGIRDGTTIAEFFQNHFSESYQIHVIRDEHYYQTLLFEQQSEHGGIRILKKDHQIVGIYLYADEDGLEVREPLCLSGYEEVMRGALSALCREKEYESVQVYAASHHDDVHMISVQKKPIIMFRILHLELLLNCLHVKENEQISCSFAVLDSIITKNSRVWRLKSREDMSIEVTETEDSEGVLTIGALTSLLFGYKTVEEIARESNVYLSEHLMQELQKIQSLDRIYLNEIV